MQCKKTQHFKYLQIKLPRTRWCVNVDKELDHNHVAEEHPDCCLLVTDAHVESRDFQPMEPALNLVQLTFSYDFPLTFSLLRL